MKLFFVFGFLWFLWFALWIMRKARRELPAGGSFDPDSVFLLVMWVAMEALMVIGVIETPWVP